MSNEEDPLPSSSLRHLDKNHESSNVCSPDHSATNSTSSSRKFTSKIVTPSQSRIQRDQPSQQWSPTMGVHNDAMYEKSKLRLAARKEHMQEAEKKLMEECTFTPETNRSRSSSKSGNSTVFDRLYSESKRTTPKKANGRRDGDSRKGSPTSVSSHGSSRIESLYQDGLRRAQNRRLTDKEEAEARRRRLEEKEMAECTFCPQMDWRKKKGGKRKENKEAPEKLYPSRYQCSPPVHVVTTQPTMARKTGQYAKIGRDDSIVSPLRGPDIASSGIDSIGEDTEYGSI